MPETGRHERIAFLLAVATTIAALVASLIDPWVSIILGLFAMAFVGYALGAQAERGRQEQRPASVSIRCDDGSALTVTVPRAELRGYRVGDRLAMTTNRPPWSAHGEIVAMDPPQHAGKLKAEL